MSIYDIQIIRLGELKTYRFDEFFSSSPIFVNSEQEIQNVIHTIHKPLLLVFESVCELQSDFIFVLDKILYTWYSTYKHIDAIHFDNNITLIKTSQWNKPGLYRAACVQPTYEIKPRLRISVFMSDNRALQPNLNESTYHSQVAVINYEYCKKHKYDFMYYRTYLDSNESYSLYNCIDPHSKETRHASWSKLISTKDIMNQSYDYVVYIDSDCIFKDFNRRIENVFDLNTDILFLNNLPWNDDKPCAGFYICKNSEISHGYIHDWYNVNMYEKNKVHAYEQDALWSIYTSWKSCTIINSWMFREHEGQFLRHICHLENDLRALYFKQFIMNHSINYSKAICNMPKKELNTNLGKK